MKHLAIIADGNRRWAKKRSLPAQVGYSQALNTIENCCDWAIENGIKFLTFYCFSTENWKRESNEIDMLMDLADQYFQEQQNWYILKNIKVIFSGRKDRLPQYFLKNCQTLEEKTKECSSLTLIICVDYGGRDEIVRAIKDGARTEEEINLLLMQYAPEPDLVIRTGGQKRLSNFLIWQIAYSELLFLDVLFPDLEFSILDEALSDYCNRQRNYGK